MDLELNSSLHRGKLTKFKRILNRSQFFKLKIIKSLPESLSDYPKVNLNVKISVCSKRLQTSRVLIKFFIFKNASLSGNFYIHEKCRQNYCQTISGAKTILEYSSIESETPSNQILKMNDYKKEIFADENRNFVFYHFQHENLI